jgi:hypothetical protein
LDFFEINCVEVDESGNISHCGVKGYGIQSIAIIWKLIREVTCFFFIYDGEKKRNVYAMTSPNGAICLTTDPRGYDKNRLNFLPLFDKSVINTSDRNCSLSKIPLGLSISN